MTELDPSLVLKAFATPQLDVGNLLETRQQLKLRNLAQAKLDRQEQDAQLAQQRRQSIGQQAATDPTGARQAAIGQGDFELVQALDKMDENTRKRVTDISRATAPLLMSLKKVDPTQRQAALQQIAPQLAERGFGENQLQQLLNGDLSDRVLDGIANSAMTIEEYNKANEAYTLSPGSKRFIGNREIASVPFAPRFDTESGTYVAPPSEGGSIFERMIGAESGGNHFTASGGVTTSPKGAIGIAQVMPGTAPEAARLAGLQWDENRYRNDPAYNRALGEAYYNKQLQDFGDPRMAVAAYNAGPGAVRAAVAKGGDWLSRLPAETQGYVAKVMGGGLPSSAPRAPGGKNAPSGYRFKADGTTLEPIPGGPADKGGAGGADRKGEADLRKEFNKEQTVKDFQARRSSWQTIDRIGKQKPTAQNDMALIFTFMKMLDPGSVVREGEFANAQNAAGVPYRIVNAYNKALSGEMMNPDQRKNMINSAATTYIASRDQYNEMARQFQGYARDYGLDPNRIAQEYKPTSPRVTGGGQGGGNIPTLTVEQARAAKPGTRFRGSDGVVRVKQ